MVHDEEPGEDLRLTRLLRAPRADAEPALWTRVRARIESRRRMPRLLVWAMRPVALAASFGLFAVSAAVALAVAGRTPVASRVEYATLADALLAERDADLATPSTPGAPGDGAVRDSGSRL